MMRPFKNGLLNQAGPMSDILEEVQMSLAQLKEYQDRDAFTMAPS